MPRNCSVVGCKSNYRSQKEKVSTFALPKDENLKKKWLRKIPTDFKDIKNPIVCIKHFTEDCIIRTDQFIVNNEIKVFERKIPKLKPGSVPTIFLNVPTYLSSSSSVSRRLCDAEQENMDKAIASSLKCFRKDQQKNEIRSIEDIVKSFSEVKCDLQKQWVHVESERKVVFCVLDIKDIPCVSSSLTVYENLSINIFVNNMVIPESKIPKQFQCINRKSLLSELFNYVERLIEDQDFNSILAVNNAVDILQKYCTENSQLKFLTEQIELITQKENNRRYRENARQRSMLLRDQPLSPLDTAVFWTEYVLRHRGTAHLQSPAKDLGFFQYFMLDVLFLLVLAGAVLTSVFRHLRRLLTPKKKLD